MGFQPRRLQTSCTERLVFLVSSSRCQRSFAESFGFEAMVLVRPWFRCSTDNGLQMSSFTFSRYRHSIGLGRMVFLKALMVLKRRKFLALRLMEMLFKLQRVCLEIPFHTAFVTNP